MIHYHMNKNMYSINPCLSFSYHLGNIMQLFLSFSRWGNESSWGVGEILDLSGAWSWVFIVTTVHVMLRLPVMPLGYLTLMQHTRLQDLTAVLISCYVNILLYSLCETPPTNNCCTPVGFGVNIAEVLERWQVSGERLLYLHCCCGISRICLSCWVVCMCIWADYQTP